VLRRVAGVLQPNVSESGAGSGPARIRI